MPDSPIKYPWAAGNRSFFDWAAFFFMGYLASLPLQPIVALHNICYVLSLLLFGLAWWRKELSFPRFNPWLLALGAYALIGVLAIAINQIDVANSIKDLRNVLFQQIYILFFTLVYIANRPGPIKLLWALCAGFFVITLMNVGQMAWLWIIRPEFFGPDFHIRQIPYGSGYGLNFQFYFPLLVGLLVFTANLSPVWRAIGLLFCLVALGTGISYNVTSAVIMIAIYLLWVTWRYLQYRFRLKTGWLIALLAVFAVISALSISKAGYDKLVAQYSMVEKGQYFEMFSRRGALWDIAVDCIRDVPLYGYGYGDKKVALICGQDRYRVAAEARGNPWADYFATEGYGKAGFHNQYLETLLISGPLGFLCWFAFWIGALCSAWGQRGEDGFHQLVTIPVALIFLGGCFFNGIWDGPPMAKGLMVVLAFAFTLHRPKQEDAI